MQPITLPVVRMHLFLGVALATIFTCLASAFAQVRPPSLGLIRYGEPAYVEAVCVPSDSSGAARIDVFIRTTFDFIVFTRNEPGKADSLYSGGLDVSFDVRNEKREFVLSANRTAKVSTNEYSETTARERSVLMHHTMYVQPGRYHVAVTLSDKGSTRERRFMLPVTAKNFAGDSLMMGSLIPVSYGSIADPSIEATAFGGSLLFNAKAAVAVSTNAPDNAQWSVTIYERNPEDASGAPLPPNASENPPPPFMLGGRKVLALDIEPFRKAEGFGVLKKNDLPSSIRFQEIPRANGKLVVFRLPLDTLDAGMYAIKLTCSANGKTDSIVQPLRIFWKDMPLSLIDGEFAVQMMRYILTEDDFDQMTSGSREEQDARLKAYWKPRDPTPDTPYNEFMAEYFRRVDQAYFNYQTTRQINGALTDRGKIYILYGPPDDVQRRLIPGEAAEEVWTYRQPEAMFRFLDRERIGAYRLAEEQ